MTFSRRQISSHERITMKTNNSHNTSQKGTKMFRKPRNILLIGIVFIGSVLVLLSLNPGISSAQNRVIRTPKPSVEKTVQRILQIPPLSNDVWTISKDGRVSFDTIDSGIDPEKAKCKGDGIKFARCVKDIVDKHSCAKVEPCGGVYCADRC